MRASLLPLRALILLAAACGGGAKDNTPDGEVGDEGSGEAGGGEAGTGGDDTGADGTGGEGSGGEGSGGEDNYGDCDPARLDSLPLFAGDPAAAWEVRYCEPTLTTEEDCMACDGACFGEIANAFATTYTESGYGYSLSKTCGPAWVDGACCFGAEISAWAEGRPLTVADEARLPRVEASAPPPGPALRWARAAAHEQASIGSFARLSLQLLALGAPASLLEGATQAQLDEVAHAASAFALARTLGASGLRPGGLSLDGLSLDADPAALLLETFVEGCINESLAAAEAAAALEAATHPAVVAHLRRVAADEARHAAFAFQLAGHLIAAHGLSTAPLRAALIAAAQRLAALPAEAGDPAHGLLDGAARRALAEEVLLHIVSPALARLEAP